MGSHRSDRPVAAAILVGDWNSDVRDYLELYVPLGWRCETCPCEITRIYAHEPLDGDPPHLICSECFGELRTATNEVRDIVARRAANRGGPKLREGFLLDERERVWGGRRLLDERERAWRSIIESAGQEPWLYPQQCCLCRAPASRALNHSVNAWSYLAICVAHREIAAQRIREWDAMIVREYLIPLSVGALWRRFGLATAGPLEPAE